MAERRMFAKTIILSDAFLDMPASARCLYFTLGLVADDDGFVNSPKSIMRQCGASLDDMQILISKKFVIAFESGVIVIKHWRIHNYIQNDRKHNTVYQDEFNMLTIDKDKNYHFMDTTCIPFGSKTDTEDRLGKDRLGKNNIYKGFTAPTLDEVREYCKERGNKVDAQKFFDYYEAMNWKDSSGKPVKNWKGKMIAVWEKEETPSPKAICNDANEYLNGCNADGEVIL